MADGGDSLQMWRMPQIYRISSHGQLTIGDPPAWHLVGANNSSP